MTSQYVDSFIHLNVITFLLKVKKALEENVSNLSKNQWLNPIQNFLWKTKNAAANHLGSNPTKSIDLYLSNCTLIKVMTIQSLGVAEFV